MKTAIKYFSGVLLLLLLGIACEKEITNPFDPDCPKGIWTPSNFQVVQTENKLDLTWQQDNMNITGFKIERKVGTMDWSNVASPEKTAKSWSDSDLKGGEVHQYRLYAYAGENSSNMVTTQATPVFTASLTTAAQTNLTCNSVTLGGNISNTGGATITERGIVYAKSDNPTTSDTKVTMGNGGGSFNQSVTGLEETATYNVRAYAINSAGTSYGNQISFTTPACAQPATVITSTPTNVTSTSATLGGNVTDDGGATVTERGVVYNTSENPTFAHNKVQIGSGKGSFSKSVTGLAENTTYFVCAYAINSQDTAYGNQESFKTSQKILTVTPSSREVGPESGTTSFTVNSNVEWIPSESSSWLTAAKTNNTTISVNFTANTSTSSRTANIKVSGGGIEKTVTVIQQEPTLVVNPLNITLPWQGGSSSISVNSNVNWNFTKDASWLNVSKTNNTTLNISCIANSTVNPRTANIIVSGGGLVRNIKVTQPGICDVEPDSKRVSWKAGTTSFSVNTGVGWSVTDDATWLTATKTSGSNISVEYQQNGSINSRTAKITASFTGNIKETATVIQNGFFDVQPNERSVSGIAGYTIFKVTSGVDWKASVKDSWLKVTIIDKTTLRVNYDSYYNIFVSRSANIRVYNADGEEKKVTLKQSYW